MFYVGAFIMIICTLGQFFLRANQFSKYYLKPFAGYRETLDATPILITRRDSVDLDDGKNEGLLNTPSSTLAKTNSAVTDQLNDHTNLPITES